MGAGPCGTALQLPDIDPGPVRSHSSTIDPTQHWGTHQMLKRAQSSVRLAHTSSRVFDELSPRHGPGPVAPSAC